MGQKTMIILRWVEKLLNKLLLELQLSLRRAKNNMSLPKIYPLEASTIKTSTFPLSTALNRRNRAKETRKPKRRRKLAQKGPQQHPKTEV